MSQNSGDESADSERDMAKKEKLAAKNGGQGERSDSLNIKVVSQAGDCMKFKVKRTTKLHRVLDSYCEKRELRKKEMRFCFDGHSIGENATPASLEMEEDDIIEVFSEQLGGGGAL